MGKDAGESSEKQFQRFKSLLGDLVRVPKEELLAKERKEKKAKARKKGKKK